MVPGGTLNRNGYPFRPLTALLALRARCGSPGSDVNRDTRPPRDTACGFPDGDFAVLLYIVSRTNTDSSGHSETSSSGKKSGSAGIGAW